MPDYLTKEEMISIGRKSKEWIRNSNTMNDTIDGNNMPVYETVRYVGFLGELKCFLFYDHSIIHPDPSSDQYRISVTSGDTHLGFEYSKKNVAGDLGELYKEIDEHFNRPKENKAQEEKKTKISVDDILKNIRATIK